MGRIIYLPTRNSTKERLQGGNPEVSPEVPSAASPPPASNDKPEDDNRYYKGRFFLKDLVDSLPKGARLLSITYGGRTRIINSKPKP